MAVFYFRDTHELNDEPKDEAGKLTARHKDVYYIDGCSQNEIKSILSDVENC